MNLFLDDLQELEREFKKEAAFAARLSENQEMWPQELTSELYKQLPFLSDYELMVSLDRVDKQRGYAFGWADVSNKTERPEVEHEEMGLPHVRIPLIVIERAVKPFTVFLDGERAVPLTEERIRETLFNPAAFDLSVSKPKDPDLVDPLMPPGRQGFGLGNGEIKMASARPSLLQAIASTIREMDRDAFVEKVASDPSLQAGFKRSGIASKLVEVMDAKLASASDRLVTLAENIEPSVVTIQKLPGGNFLVKSANVDAFAPDQDATGQVVQAEEAAQAIGDQAAQIMQPGQTATAVADPVEPAAPQELGRFKPIDEFGQYKVVDVAGNSLFGHVFPQTLSWDGNFTPESISLFTNGSAYAVQDTITGEFVSKATNLPEDQPLGDGVFYTIEKGEAICTGPVTVRSSTVGPDGLPALVAMDMFGNQFQVKFVQGLKTPMRISDVEYGFPDNWSFMRLNNQTQLARDEQQAMANEAVKEAQTSVTLFYNGAYNIEGGCGLEKLDDQFRYDLDPVSAEFTLGLLGVDGVTAKQKVAEARKKGSIKLAGLKTITTLAERREEAVKEASALLAQLPDLRRDLIKEAAVLEDEGTVDKVLALNFINPENLATFVEYLPELEQTAEKLAEMLMASYLGMQELPENALDRSMKNLEEVITSLKALQHSDIA